MQAMQATATTSAPSRSRSLSRHATSGRSSAARSQGKGKHPLLLFVSVFYAVAHLGLLWKQSQLWISSVKAGHVNTRAANGQLLVAAWELVTLAVSAFLQHGLLTGASDAAIADRGFLPIAVVVPLFQHVMALTSPEFLSVERGWWAFHGTMVVLGVIHGFTPAHTLLQVATTTPLAAIIQCYGKCYTQPCGVTLRSFYQCFLTHGYLIAMSGIAAWAITYSVGRAHYRRQANNSTASTASDAGTSTAPPVAPTGAAAAVSGELPPPHRTGSFGALFPAAEQISSGLAKLTLSSLSRRRQPTPSTHDAASHPPTSGTSEGHTPMRSASSHMQPGSSRTDPTSGHTRSQLSSDSDASPMPFETFGIHVFEYLGVAPYLRQLEVRLNRLFDKLEDGLVVRIVCLPIGAYSLTFALMVRMRFAGYSFSNLSSDMFLLYMAVWFLLGRDSCTFDVAAAMQQVREQLAASFAALSQPRPQTVTELVDSVRQQIAGGSITPGFEGNIGGDEIQVLEMLGEGTFGKVHKGMWRGTVVAIKSMVLPSNAGLRRERMAIMEAAISAALSHPHVLQTYTYSMQPLKDSGAPQDAASSNLSQTRPTHGSQATLDSHSSSSTHGMEVRLVLEYMDKGTLRDALDNGIFLNMSGDEVDFDAVLETASEVAKGMLHLHSLNILHGDLKARNVLLKSSALDPRGFTTKIADFGLSQKMEEMETHISSMFQGTPSHMAPEVFLEGTQSKAADVYAYGITLWEMYTGRRAFTDVAKALLPHHVAEKGERPHFPRGTPSSYAQLAQRCWSADPATRPTFKEIVAALVELQRACDSGELLTQEASASESGVSGDLGQGFGVTYEGGVPASQLQGGLQMLAHWRDVDRGPRLSPQSTQRRRAASNQSLHAASHGVQTTSQGRSSTLVAVTTASTQSDAAVTPKHAPNAALGAQGRAPSSSISPLEQQPTAHTGQLPELPEVQAEAVAGSSEAGEGEASAIQSSQKFVDGLPDSPSELPSAIMVGNLGDTNTESMW